MPLTRAEIDKIVLDVLSEWYPPRGFIDGYVFRNSIYCAYCGGLALIPGSAGQVGPLLCLKCSDHVQRLQRLREWGVIR